MSALLEQMNPASRAQVEAAEPRASTWLAANAGSGKTRVLTDRVARLLLLDVAPQNILCLTYTKAAASEMQNRLFKRLGEWAMMEPGALSAQLAELGGAAPQSGDDLAKARRLFARAIETPGGLKIQTIHSFCASLLRRFPLEAGVSPGFTEIDDRTAQTLRRDILNWMASEHPGVFDAFAVIAGGSDLEELAGQIAAQRRMYPAAPDPARIFAELNLPSGMTAEQSIQLALQGDEGAMFEAVKPILAAGSGTMIKLAAILQAFIDTPNQASFEAIADCALLKGKSEASKRYLTKGAREDMGGLAEEMDDFARRLGAVRDTQKALATAERTLALHAFAASFLTEYSNRKAAAGWLDFEDLLIAAHGLLSHSDMAGWVLYRLDGGIDHVLVDEAQDTSPLQWSIIEKLTEELTSGIGSRANTLRTLFVVGDKKQSIYSFQGADPSEFDRMRERFDSALTSAGPGLAARKLEYSFRSSPTILNACDATFRAGFDAGLEAGVSHAAFFDAMPGRVDLWPVIEKQGEEPGTDWDRPSGDTFSTHHSVALARRIASEITRMKDQEVLWHREDDGTFAPRRITEGDVLILVQRRADLFYEILRACKSAGLKVAGADVVKLGNELAVKDILSLLSFVLTPEDDLALAEALKSPLLGWDEAQLYDLAANRGGKYLWQSLREDHAATHPDTVALLQDLLNDADFLRPYELLDRLLTHHQGRRNLIARLGPEAAEAIDLLSEQALSFEQSSVPSLTGFVAWLTSEEVDLKRQPDAAGGALRVMSVHGAKGLEAPIVFLPDAGNRREEIRDPILQSGAGPFWKPPSVERPSALEPLADTAREKISEERARLLYVAMTRAEQWLVVCAAGEADDPVTSWHQRVAGGLDALSAPAHSFAQMGEGLRLQNWPAHDLPTSDGPPLTGAAHVPDWAREAAPPPTPRVNPLSPSRLTGPKALAGEGGLDAETAKARGTMLHRLLEVLPETDPSNWPAIAAQAMAALGAQPGFDTAQVLAEAQRVLAAPDLAHLFAPGALSEVPVTATLGGRRLIGTIDKLIIEPDHVLAVDFKSNVTVPNTPEDTPLGITRQMGAYAEALGQIFPDNRIDTAILWTSTAELMALSHASVIAALRAEPLLDGPPAGA